MDIVDQTVSTADHDAYFDDFPERYARFNVMRERLMPATAEWLRANLPGGHRAVDLGCGEGRWAAMLAGRYDEVLAVDVSDRMLDLAQASGPPASIDYQRRGVLEVTPERDGVFDAVLSVNVLHHVGPLPEVMPHVRRLVAPGGRLVVADIVNPGGWGDPDYHIDQALNAAKSFYQLAGGDPDVAADVIRLMLHPRWLDMMVADIPPSREQFHDQVEATLPGAELNDALHPVMCAVAWQAPGP